MVRWGCAERQGLVGRYFSSDLLVVNATIDRPAHAARDDAVDGFVLPPTALAIADAADVLYLAVFVSVATLVSTLTGALRRADALNRALVTQEQAARADAEAAHRAKDVFLAKISHELRTSLQATSGWAQLLDRVRHDESLFVKTLAALHRCIGTQSMLIDDLLAASQVIAGKMHLSIELVSLGPVVEAAVATAKTVARLPQPAVHVAVDPFVGPVRGDRVRLEQIVCNLVSNALKFTSPEGRVDVRVEREPQNVCIIVADTGRGIPKEMISRLFDEFWQAPTGHPQSGEGLGLGLTIVRQLVHMHGGTIQAESAGVGLGATFVVTLPSAKPEAPLAVTPSATTRWELPFARAHASDPTARESPS